MFEFHAKSKIGIEVSLAGESRAGIHDRHCVSSPGYGAIIRVKLKSRGYLFILFDQLTSRGMLHKEDRFFISSGWEDVIILKQEAAMQDILTLQRYLYKNNELTERLQSFFFRSSVFGCTDRNDAIPGLSFISFIRLNHPMSVTDAETLLGARLKAVCASCFELLRTYGTMDYSVKWHVDSIQTMDSILKAIETDQAINTILDDIQTNLVSGLDSAPAQA
jgi:hypothetical protein